MVADRTAQIYDYYDPLRAEIDRVAANGGQATLYKYLRVPNLMGIPSLNRFLGKRFPFENDSAAWLIDWEIGKRTGWSDPEIEVKDRKGWWARLTGGGRITKMIYTSPQGLSFSKAIETTSDNRGRIYSYEVSYRVSAPASSSVV